MWFFYEGGEFKEKGGSMMKESKVQKECDVCHTVLPLKKFPFSMSDGFGDTCKECVKDSEAFKGRVEAKSVVENAVEDFNKSKEDDKVVVELHEMDGVERFVKVKVSQEYPPIKGRAEVIFKEHLIPYIHANGDKFTATDLRKYLWPKWNPNRIHTVLQEVVKEGFISKERYGQRVYHYLKPKGEQLLEDYPAKIEISEVEEEPKIELEPVLEEETVPKEVIKDPEFIVKDEVLKLVALLFGKVEEINIYKDSISVELGETKDIIEISNLLPVELRGLVDVSIDVEEDDPCLLLDIDIKGIGPVSVEGK